MPTQNNIRIIARLDIKGPHVVKGIHLEGLRVLGDPAYFARRYYEMGADELIYMDVVASLYNRNSLHQIIKRAGRELFIPMTVGGGLRTIDDIREVLRSGADKVAINTAAIRNPGIIKEAANKFGSSTIVVAIEAIRQSDGRYLAFTDNGREYTGVDAITWARQAEEYGAGEIMITSVDREGTGEGFDIELVKSLAGSISIPLIAHGGAGSVEDIHRVIAEGGADAVAIASIIHYDLITKEVTAVDTTQEGNIEFLKKNSGFIKIRPASIAKIKAYLKDNGIVCRPVSWYEESYSAKFEGHGQ
ncbi:MAG: imidazole glycerol phosphate synthase cyclase subunit [Candidatus Omnitrophica bacterium]|nr:imidazole glycerol phosphate synthase cyclase subunit [Candidatus Omnitrophota bacterium]